VAGEPGADEHAAALTAPFLDTNVLVRYFTREPADMAAHAAALIDGGLRFTLSNVVLAETGFVLESVYRRPRQDIVQALIALVQKANMQPRGVQRSTLVEALRLCGPSRRVSFADALLWAEARDSAASVVYSFDREFPTTGIELRDAGDEPGVGGRQPASGSRWGSTSAGQGLPPC
jgi:predicted nucleic acid-binding protein